MPSTARGRLKRRAPGWDATLDDDQFELNIPKGIAVEIMKETLGIKP